jgi:PAS domain S-box-containing protein
MKKNTSISNKDRGHFFSIFENEPLGVAQTASDDHLLMVNGTLCRMLGYQRRDLLQKTFKELTHPDERSREAKIIDELVRGTETSYEIEKRYLRRYGSSVWVKETSSAVRGADGSFLHRISVIQVDQGKSAAERFRLAIEAAPNGMVLVDHKSRIVLVNAMTEPAPVRLFTGLGREETRVILAAAGSCGEKPRQSPFL